MEMNEKMYIHEYLLHSRKGLNSRSHLTAHEGALIRVEKDGVSGYGCLHPWVELGDSSLEKLIGQLKEGRISRQVKCALECADADRNARAAGVSLFEGLNIPVSHATIVGGIDRVELAAAAGFDTVKLKVGRDVQENLKLLREVHDTFPKLKMRLDFNGVSGPGALEFLLIELGETAREQIDFIEDPFPLSNPAWDTLRDKYGVKFAVDRGISGANGEFDVSVLKPAINKTDRLCNAAQLSGRRVVVTSYMDHPVGQSYAAYCAGMMDRKYLGLIDKRCGLMTHGLFEPTEFTESLGNVSPFWKDDHCSTGLGFDDLLDKLDWDRL